MPGILKRLLAAIVCVWPAIRRQTITAMPRRKLKRTRRRVESGSTSADDAIELLAEGNDRASPTGLIMWLQVGWGQIEQSSVRQADQQVKLFSEAAHSAFVLMRDDLSAGGR